MFTQLDMRGLILVLDKEFMLAEFEQNRFKNFRFPQLESFETSRTISQDWEGQPSLKFHTEQDTLQIYQMVMSINFSCVEWGW
jgi:hypothetical protein